MGEFEIRETMGHTLGDVIIKKLRWGILEYIPWQIIRKLPAWLWVEVKKETNNEGWEGDTL